MEYELKHEKEEQIRELFSEPTVDRVLESDLLRSIEVTRADIRDILTKMESEGKIIKSEYDNQVYWESVK